MDRDGNEVYLAPNGSSQALRSFLTWGVCGSHGALITTLFPAAGRSSVRPAAVGLCSRAVTPLCHFSSWRREPHGKMHNPVTCSAACATQSTLRSVHFLHSLFTMVLLDTWKHPHLSCSEAHALSRWDPVDVQRGEIARLKFLQQGRPL